MRKKVYHSNSEQALLNCLRFAKIVSELFCKAKLLLKCKTIVILLSDKSKFPVAHNTKLDNRTIHIIMLDRYWLDCIAVEALVVCISSRETGSFGE